jgi:hypothetical protein
MLRLAFVLKIFLFVSIFFKAISEQHRAQAHQNLGLGLLYKPWEPTAKENATAFYVLYVKVVNPEFLEPDVESGSLRYRVFEPKYIRIYYENFRNRA